MARVLECKHLAIRNSVTAEHPYGLRLCDREPNTPLALDRKSRSPLFTVCLACEMGHETLRDHNICNDNATNIREPCHSHKDGDCTWAKCPQIRDGEADKSGRHCPLDVILDDDYA
jgi:hypothetical protein